ncbi:hypothetical protein D9757_005330 [Collybiopsis confluens]|uniref:Cupin type-2 domain-containing protein n=1 Tax=Collybiopsis confluens TaxID=2823264 RepID=A0A8H5M9B8_9AGAR|nr:hypothetical protein D9757_005330 [Collybiopsis confluens]
MSSDFPALKRIVTSHDEQGQSNILSQSVVVTQPTAFAGVSVAPIWTIVDGLPTKDNNDVVDGAERKIQDNLGLVPANGVNVQITELAPGSITPNHRTSSLDCNFLLAGEVTLVMTDGSEVTLREAGDSVVMRGGIHLWKNLTTKPCRWATVLISADPVIVGGKALEPEVR